MEQGMSLARYWRAFGCGDEKRGRTILEQLVERIEYAREKHGWGNGKEIDSVSKAAFALGSEVGEWSKAVAKESADRQFDEALDILAVAVRIANQEYNL